VENLCGYAQRDLAVPLLTQAAIDGVAVDIRAANAAAAAWCVEVNALVHSEIAAIPGERLIAERELLQPLPSLRLQIGRRRCCAESTDSRMCATARPATRYPPGSSAPPWPS
jgi:hypothetical protein